VQLQDRAANAWGALGAALTLALGIPSLVAAEHYKRTPWWVWLGVAIAGVFFLVAAYIFVPPLLRRLFRSRTGSEGMSHSDDEADPRRSELSHSGIEISRERTAYRVSGRGKARPVRPHIRNQDVAFDVREDGELDDTDSDIS
jgi:hypothetical protein